MKTAFSLLAAVVACSQILAAQSTAQAPPIYANSISYHVPDESRIALESWLKDKYRRYVEAMMKENPAIQAYSVTRVVFGGVKEPEANFQGTLFTQGIPKQNLELQNKVTQQLFGKSYADFLKEALPLRHRLGQILTVRTLGTPPLAVEGDLLRFDFRKVQPGRGADYTQLERDWLPLREAQVKAGKIKAWSASNVVLPGGTERDFDAFTVHTAKDLEQALTWNQGSNAINNQLTHPVNVTGLVLRGQEISKIVRTETRLVVMMVRRP